MNTARIVVLIVALSAGGVAAYLARGSDAAPPPAEVVAQLPTVDVQAVAFAQGERFMREIECVGCLGLHAIAQLE